MAREPSIYANKDIRKLTVRYAKIEKKSQKRQTAKETRRGKKEKVRETEK